MFKSRWSRLLAQFALSALAFTALVWVALLATDRFLSIQQRGGDQSQSSMIDPAPAERLPPLPVVDWPELRNVVLIVGDGMGFSQVMAARSEIERLNRRLFLERFPITGWQTTHSLDAIYTDSAASASSLATGRKVPYLSLSMSPEGEAYRTVMEAARDHGMAIGAVTDSYLWDATPAAFLSHVAHRREMRSIAAQMAGSGAEVLVGETHEEIDFDLPGESAPAAPLRTLFRDAGFRIVEDAAAFSSLEADSQQPVLGLFPTGQIADPELAPELPQIAEFALQRLSRDPDGFFLLIESEEPDSGGHQKDLERIVAGVRAIDQIARIAVEMALRDESTLVLITADHETGGMAILHGDDEHPMGVRWATTSHSSEPVPLYAFGAGAARFGGVRDNTELARTLSDLLGLGLFEVEGH